MEDVDIEWLNCNACGGRRRHRKCHSYTSQFPDLSLDDATGEEVVDGVLDTSYTLYLCLGCESAILVTLEDIGGHVIRTETPEKTIRNAPTWLFRFFADRELYELLHEIYNATNRGCLRLALMGSRAVVDIVLTRSVGDVGGFKHKLKAMAKSGSIRETDRELLDALVDAGSAASHRGYCPDEAGINAVLDAMEHFVLASAIAGTAKKIRSGVPQRKFAAKPGEADGA